jgi:hypothetical protein
MLNFFLNYQITGYYSRGVMVGVQQDESEKFSDVVDKEEVENQELEVKCTKINFLMISE